MDDLLLLVAIMWVAACFLNSLIIRQLIKREIRYKAERQRRSRVENYIRYLINCHNDPTYAERIRHEYEAVEGGGNSVEA